MAFFESVLASGGGSISGTVSISTSGVTTVNFGVSITPKIVIIRRLYDGFTSFYFGDFGTFYQDYSYVGTIASGTTAPTFTRYPLSNTANAHISEVGVGYFKFNYASAPAWPDHTYYVV